MTRHGKIQHSHDMQCQCEPVLGIVCDCTRHYDPSKADPACDVCHGLGVYRLPLGVAPRGDMLQMPICRDGNEGRYPIWTADPPGDEE